VTDEADALANSRESPGVLGGKRPESFTDEGIAAQANPEPWKTDADWQYT